MRYRLTSLAKQDIQEIGRYIRDVQKSPQNARLVVTRLQYQFRALADVPTIGHHSADLRDDAARIISVSGLLVIYDPGLKPLTVLRVVHSSRDLSRIATR